MLEKRNGSMNKQYDFIIEQYRIAWDHELSASYATWSREEVFRAAAEVSNNSVTVAYFRVKLKTKA